MTRKNAELLKINWTDGTCLRLTPDHRVLTYKRGWVKAQDLQEGESVVSLKKHFQTAISIGRSRWPLEHRVIAEKIFGSIPKGFHVDHIDGNSFNNNPENLQLLSPQEHAKKTFTGVYRTKQAVNKTMKAWKKWSLSEEGRKKLSVNGSRRSKSFWDSLSKSDRQLFIYKRNLKRKEGYDDWWNKLSIEEKSTWGDKGRQMRWNHKVKNIEKAGFEDVYDMKVEDNHNFIANGVVVHNCDFYEINCISGIKAQAFGAVPVVINYAALKETVRFGEKIEGDIWDKQIKKAYTKALIQAFSTNYDRETMSKTIQGLYSWDAITNLWVKEFEI